MQSGGSEQRSAIHNLQDQLQFDDPINIQFTSVSQIIVKGASLDVFQVISSFNSQGTLSNRFLSESC